MTKLAVQNPLNRQMAFGAGHAVRPDPGKNDYSMNQIYYIIVIIGLTAPPLPLCVGMSLGGLDAG